MEELNLELNHAIVAHEMFKIPFLFGWEISITDTIITMWLVMAIIILFAYVITRNMTLIPKGKQKIAEFLVGFVNNLSKDAIGHHWKSFAPYLGALILFLGVSNIMGIFNIIPTSEDLYHLTGLAFFEHLPVYHPYPPTKNINVPATLAIMSVVLIIGAEIRFKGVKGWFNNLFQPVPVIMPFKLLEYGIKPMSLCLRLFGNILAAFIIMELVYFALPAFVPAALSIYFDLFDGLLQAYVFVFLTALFIGEAVE